MHIRRPKLQTKNDVRRAQRREQPRELTISVLCEIELREGAVYGPFKAPPPTSVLPLVNLPSYFTPEMKDLYYIFRTQKCCHM